MSVEILSRPEADDLARECVYRFLAAVAGGPDSGWGRALGALDQDLAIDAAAWLLSDCEALDRLAKELRAPRATLRAQYDRVFGLVVPRE